LPSYALARLIDDLTSRDIYQSPKWAKRATGHVDCMLVNGQNVPPGWEKTTKHDMPYVCRWFDSQDRLIGRDKLPAKLQTNRCHSYMEPGGMWACDVALHRAERDGDTRLAIALRVGQAYEFAAMCHHLKVSMLRPFAPRMATLFLLTS
jgi:hypothetical protein